MGCCGSKPPDPATPAPGAVDMKEDKVAHWP